MLLLTDYFRSTHDAAWDIDAQCGVRHGVIRLPENEGFDYGSPSHWAELKKRFTDFGITPVAIEPMPNELHDHIKLGDGKRDESIEKVISMFPNMQKEGIRLNFVKNLITIIYLEQIYTMIIRFYRAGIR